MFDPVPFEETGFIEDCAGTVHRRLSQCAEITRMALGLSRQMTCELLQECPRRSIGQREGWRTVRYEDCGKHEATSLM